MASEVRGSRERDLPLKPGLVSVAESPVGLGERTSPGEAVDKEPSDFALMRRSWITRDCKLPPNTPYKINVCDTEFFTEFMLRGISVALQVPKYQPSAVVTSL
ncbi:hypothetical protein QYM36_012185 [Artemia franciscana]|uniref:Uncharacterized protein n=1 Tax=Artemia franciscana TaxID=6661 RepID=A0AA88L2L7_ARTSF|nr:hypothetical protein QYM36_012185 [Artemia franciscana]